MSLKTDFNKQLRLLFPSGCLADISEVCMLHGLILALHGNPRVVGTIMHQHYVSFACMPSGSARRELCDLFLIQIFDNYFRFSFIQTKKETKCGYTGLSDFHVDCLQHQLLVSRPVIKHHSFTSDILVKCKYDTATTYAVFYDDSCGNIEFDLSAANKVSCKSCSNVFSGCSATSHKAIHLLNKLTFTKKRCLLSEYISHKNINEIEKYYEFGEVVYYREANKSDFWHFVSLFKESTEIANIFRKCINIDLLVEKNRSNELLNISDFVGPVVFVDCRNKKLE